MKTMTAKLKIKVHEIEQSQLLKKNFILDILFQIKLLKNN